MDIAKALEFSWPGVHWSLNGETYDGLVWPTDDKPSIQDIEDAWVLYVDNRNKNQYKSKRAEEYIKIDGEGLDSIRMALLDIYGSMGRSPESNFHSYVQKIDLIKKNNPKPQD